MNDIVSLVLENNPTRKEVEDRLTMNSGFFRVNHLRFAASAVRGQKKVITASRPEFSIIILVYLGNKFFTN